jgi:hypothetical protein
VLVRGDRRRGRGGEGLTGGGVGVVGLVGGVGAGGTLRIAGGTLRFGRRGLSGVTGAGSTLRIGRSGLTSTSGGGVSVAGRAGGGKVAVGTVRGAGVGGLGAGSGDAGAACGRRMLSMVRRVSSSVPVRGSRGVAGCGCFCWYWMMSSAAWMMSRLEEAGSGTFCGYHESVSVRRVACVSGTQTS